MFLLEHTDDFAQATKQFIAAIALDDERNAPLGMLFQRKELPRMVVMNKLPVVSPSPSCPTLVEPQGKIVEREPEEGEAEPRSDGGRYLKHAVLHERDARLVEVHISPRNESGIETGVVEVALSL